MMVFGMVEEVENSKKIIIIVIVVILFILLLFCYIVYGIFFCKSRRERRKFICEVN